ncbi:GFA family protein [Alishewanella longhuensis]
MKCQCLCGSISFELIGLLGDIYKCHCSLCRMNTGSSNSAALVV